MNLKKLMEKPLSDSDITKATNGKTNIYTYSDITKYDDIDDLFNGKDSITILYRTNPNYGHWCCLNKINESLIEWFDPYGIFPDDEQKLMDNDTRINLNQYLPHLSKLMKNSKYQLSYNNHKFQEWKKGINTCGRHCIIRTLFRNIPLENYKKFFVNNSKYGNPDEIVTILTKQI